jgi:hypothetical protein
MRTHNVQRLDNCTTGRLQGRHAGRWNGTYRSVANSSPTCVVCTATIRVGDPVDRTSGVSRGSMRRYLLGGCGVGRYGAEVGSWQDDGWRSLSGRQRAG